MSNTNTSAPTTTPASPLAGKSGGPAGDPYDKDYVEKQRQQYAQQQQAQMQMQMQMQGAGGNPYNNPYINNNNGAPPPPPQPWDSEPGSCAACCAACCMGINANTTGGKEGTGPRTQQQQQQQWQPASPDGTRQAGQEEEEAAAVEAYGCCIANYGVSDECGCCGGDGGNTFPLPCCPAYSCCTPYSQHIAFRVILFLLSLLSVIALGLSLAFYFVEVSGVMRETRTTTDNMGVSTTTVTYTRFWRTVYLSGGGNEYSYYYGYSSGGGLYDPFATEQVMVYTATACQFVAFLFLTAMLGFRVTAERQIQSDTRYAAALGPAEVTRRARRRVSVDQALAWCANVFLLLTFGLLVATMTRAASGAGAQNVMDDYTSYSGPTWGGASRSVSREKFGRNAVKLRESFYMILGVTCGVVCMLLILHSSTLNGADLFIADLPSTQEEQREAEAGHAGQQSQQQQPQPQQQPQQPPQGQAPPAQTAVPPPQHTERADTYSYATAVSEV